jgi:hypothetical protein
LEWRQTWTLRNRIEVTVDEESVFAAVSGLQLGDQVLDVSVVMGHPVGKFQVERASWLLEINVIKLFSSYQCSGQKPLAFASSKHFQDSLYFQART